MFRVILNRDEVANINPGNTASGTYGSYYLNNNYHNAWKCSFPDVEWQIHLYTSKYLQALNMHNINRFYLHIYY